MSTLTSDERKAALRTLISNGLTFGQTVEAFAAADKDPDNKIRAQWARENLQHDGEIEIDSNAIVSAGSDPGAYVSAWVWVPDSEIWDGETDSDGEPCRMINHYSCDDCDTYWEDQWSCACNDKCALCGKEIEPDASIELDLNGDPLPGQEQQAKEGANGGV